ncbi:MAG: acetylglutamate kinase [Chloroflexota bacterium]|nr:acetylglutamate kinase [Chloroflexota bacterium]
MNGAGTASGQVTPQITNALRRIKGKYVVVKLGGEVMLNAEGLDALASDIALLSRQGVRMVVVHGGGPQADRLAQQLGHAVHKVGGRRITDDSALEVAKMVYAGSINIDLLAALRSHGARGVGISGVDGGLITATHRPLTYITNTGTGKDEWVDFGHVGDIISADTSLLELLLRSDYVPVVASLAGDNDGHIYNVNADTVAQVIAVALGAERLVLVTNVLGILSDPADPTSLLPVCDQIDIAEMVDKGAISGGMLPKVHNCLEAISAGVGSVQIIDGTGKHPPLLESLTAGGVGTLITKGRSETKGGPEVQNVHNLA